MHRSLRKIIKTRGSFPNDDAALKLLYLAIRNAGLRWRRGTEWTAAMGQSAIQFGERFPGTADDHGDRHHGKADHRLARSFAVKPRAFGTPLRGLGA